MQGAAIPQGDRVTATAVRVIGQELERFLVAYSLLLQENYLHLLYVVLFS